jgi:hypothetical protein
MGRILDHVAMDKLKGLVKQLFPLLQGIFSTLIPHFGQFTRAGLYLIVTGMFHMGT